MSQSATGERRWGDSPHPGDALDQALDLLAPYGPEYGIGGANHAPMLAEALCAMGGERRVLNAVREYLPTLDQPAPGVHDSHAPKLGAIEDFALWHAYFSEALAADGVTKVLDAWTFELSKGLVGAAFHGLIRTAHAARACSPRATPQRMDELARGLSYWAARYERMNADDSRRAEHSSPWQMLVSLVPHPDAARPTSGLIIPRLHARSLGLSLPLPTLPTDVDAAVQQARIDALRLWTWSEHDASATFALLHGVTAAAAVETLSAFVSSRTTRSLVEHLYVALGAIRIAMVPSIQGSRDGAMAPAPSADTLREGVLASSDDHVIKLGEACLRDGTPLPEEHRRALAQWMTPSDATAPP